MYSSTERIRNSLAIVHNLFIMFINLYFVLKDSRINFRRCLNVSGCLHMGRRQILETGHGKVGKCIHVSFPAQTPPSSCRNASEYKNESPKSLPLVAKMKVVSRRNNIWVLIISMYSTLVHMYVCALETQIQFHVLALDPELRIGLFAEIFSFVPSVYPSLNWDGREESHFPCFNYLLMTGLLLWLPIQMLIS
jgi:hypothetical protein